MNTNELSCISAELHTNLYLICAPSPNEDTLGKNISYVPLKWPFIESFKRGHVLLNFFKGWREVCVRLYAWQWLSGLRSAVRLCWVPDGFNLSPATPSVTGGSRGSSGCPGGARTGGVSSGTLLVKHLKKKIEIYAEFDSESFKNTPRLGRGRSV